nr:hypothetical protein [Tanacetum cinerariifolium]
MEVYHTHSSMPPTSSLPPFMVCGVGGWLVTLWALDGTVSFLFVLIGIARVVVMRFIMGWKAGQTLLHHYKILGRDNIFMMLDSIEHRSFTMYELAYGSLL